MVDETGLQSDVAKGTNQKEIQPRVVYKKYLVIAPGKFLGCDGHFTKGFSVQYQLISNSHIGVQHLFRTTTKYFNVDRFADTQPT